MHISPHVHRSRLFLGPTDPETYTWVIAEISGGFWIKTVLRSDRSDDANAL